MSEIDTTTFAGPLPQSLPAPVANDPRAIDLYQIVIIALAATGLLVVIGGLVLSFFDRAVPESVIVLGSVAIGALASMVATGRSN